MVATAPAVRRALVGALLALTVLSVLVTALFLAWGGRHDAASGSAEEPPAPVPEVLREPVVVKDQTPESAPETEPMPQVEAPGASAEPQPETRRAASERRPEGTGSLRLRADLQSAVLWVGSGGSLPLDAPAAPAAAALAGGWLRRCGGSPTDAWGADGLPPGPLRVLLVAPNGPRIELDGLWILAGETLDLGRLVPPDPQRVELLVLGPDGAPVPGARVGLVGDRPGGARDALGLAAASPLGATDAEGVVSLLPPLGAWRLRVEGPGLDPHRLAPRVLDGESTSSDEPLVLTIEMAPGGEVSGDVLDPDALGFAGRRIAAWNPAGPGPSSEAALALGLPVDALATVFGVTVTAEGRYVFRDLPADVVLRLRALVDSDLAHADAFAPLATARAGERGVFVTQHASASLELEVLQLDTLAPLESFSVELPGTWPGGARAGRDGRLLWSGLRPFEAAEDATFADLPESPDLELSVQADGHDLALAPLVRLRTGETTRAPRIVLRPLPFVHVRVVDARDGAVLEGASCELAAVLPELAVGRTSSAAKSDAAGRARLTTTSNNLSELLVRCPGYAPRRLRAPLPNEAAQPLEVALAPGAVLRVRVLDAEGNPVRAQVLRRRTSVETGDPLAQDFERALTDADGRAEFHDLEAGPTSVAACALTRSDLELAPPTGSMTWVAVGVPMGGASEVELGALAARAVELELRWQERVLPGAVLRLSGDLGAFSAPHDDARTFLTGPAVRADGEGRVSLGLLHEGLYAVRVEHPLVPGFARALLPVGGGGVGLRTLELASERLRGEVGLDGERVWKGKAVVWAHGPYYELGLEVEPGSVLRELVPEPIYLGECPLTGGVFDLPVPSGVELIVTAADGEASGDYFVALPEGPREAITVAIEPSLTLEVAVDLRGKRGRTRELGVVGYNRHQPWGRGLIAVALEEDGLAIADLPPGTWRLCLVELAGGQLVVERGDWSEYELDGGRNGVRLYWNRPVRR